MRRESDQKGGGGVKKASSDTPGMDFVCGLINVVSLGTLSLFLTVASRSRKARETRDREQAQAAKSQAKAARDRASSARKARKTALQGEKLSLQVERERVRLEREKAKLEKEKGGQKNES